MKISNRKRNRVPGRGKGHALDVAARDEVLGSIEGLPHTPEQLIECLHRIQDRFGHLAAKHLVALADLLRLAPAEVYEVATFYHHFDVVHEGGIPPPPLTVRVCDSVTCEMFGAQALVQALEVGLGDAATPTSTFATTVATPNAKSGLISADI